MKKIRNFCLIALAATSFLACEKNAVDDITKPYDGALFKVYNFAFTRSSSTPILTFNPYANGVKFAAILSTTTTESASGITVGGVAPARGYSLVPAGDNVTFTAVTPALAAPNATTGFGPGLEIANVVKSVQNGKNYSFYVCGEFDKITQKADGFILEDILPAADTGAAYIRLVNPAPNTSTLTMEATRTYKVDGIDVVEVTEPISGVAYKSASDFVKVSSGSYTFKVKDVMTNKVVNRTATSLLKNRIYTFTVRGDLVGAASYPTLLLDFTENR